MQWTFPEYEKPQRGSWWYVIMIALGGGLAAYALFDGNFLFALIIILFAFILFTHHRSEPMTLAFTVYETGLQIGDKFYLFREVESFSVIYEPPMVKRLYIVLKNAVLRKEIAIPLRNQNPLNVRSLLLDFLTEDLEREEETLNDTLARVFKI